MKRNPDHERRKEVLSALDRESLKGVLLALAISAIVTIIIITVTYAIYEYPYKMYREYKDSSYESKSTESSEPKEQVITLNSGLKCHIVIVSPTYKFHVCNMAKYNHETHYGQYPYAVEDLDGNNSQESDNEANEELN